MATALTRSAPTSETCSRLLGPIIAEKPTDRPAVPQRRFLDFFCPTCVTRPSTNGRQPPVDEDNVGARTESSSGRWRAPIRGVTRSNLEDAILRDRACQAGAEPLREQRRALRRPRAAQQRAPMGCYHFITQNSPRTKWGSDLHRLRQGVREASRALPEVPQLPDRKE